MAGLDKYTLSLLHFNGDVKDECGNTWNIYGYQDPFSTSIYKFGSGSFPLRVINNNQVHNEISMGNSLNIFPFTSDWTIDWWEYITGSGSYTWTIGDMNGYNGAIFYTAGGFCLDYNDGSNKYIYIANSAKTGWIANKQLLGPVSNSQWIHRAVVRKASQFYAFTNGKIMSTWTSTDSMSKFTSDGLSTAIIIGKHNVYDTSYDSSITYIDEFRLSNIARWTEEFIPPVNPYSSAHSIYKTETNDYYRMINT